MLKLSQYADLHGVTYRTAWNRYKRGKIPNARMDDTGHVVINRVTEDETDLMQDFVSLVTSFTARLYGRRRSKRNTEKLIKELRSES
jgi:predicted site-specific integrase-resolvase